MYLFLFNAARVCSSSSKSKSLSFQGSLGALFVSSSLLIVTIVLYGSKSTLDGRVALAHRPGYASLRRKNALFTSYKDACVKQYVSMRSLFFWRRAYGTRRTGYRKNIPAPAAATRIEEGVQPDDVNVPVPVQRSETKYVVW